MKEQPARTVGEPCHLERDEHGSHGNRPANERPESPGVLGDKRPAAPYSEQEEARVLEMLGKALWD